MYKKYILLGIKRDIGFEKGWVNKHIANEEDRHHGYYAAYFIARYAGEATGTAEESDKFEWCSIESAVKSVSINKVLYDKALASGYLTNKLEEETLNEGKQVGTVSYCVRGIGKEMPSAVILNKILKTNFIKASEPDSTTWPYGKAYVSLSRDLASHIGPTWKCGVVLDGDKISNKYKIQPIDHNSQIYFLDNVKSAKTVQVNAIAKFDNVKDPTEHFYYVFLYGDSFKTVITKETYEVLKQLMLLYNKKLAVQTTKGKEKYQGKEVAEVKKYSDKPARFF